MSNARSFGEEPKRPKLSEEGGTASSHTTGDEGGQALLPDVQFRVNIPLSTRDQLLSFQPLPFNTPEALLSVSDLFIGQPAIVLPLSASDTIPAITNPVATPRIPVVSLPVTCQPTSTTLSSTSTCPVATMSFPGGCLEISELTIHNVSESEIITNVDHHVPDITCHSLSPGPMTVSSQLHTPPSLTPVYSELQLTQDDYYDAHCCDQDHPNDFGTDPFHDAQEFFLNEDDPLATFPGDFSPTNTMHASKPALVAEKLSDIYQGNQRISADQCPPTDPPIYSGSSVSVSESAIAFLTLMLSYNVSGELMGKFLSFIQLILPSDNKFFSSLHCFLKYFESIKSPMKFIYYCSICLRGLTEKDSVCTKCGKDGKVNYYIYLPIIHQIRDLYANPAFVEALSYRFNRTKTDPNNFEDIIDGELWKSAEASGILSQPLNTSLMWNSDGLSIYNSSNFQIWPMYLVFNELPPNLRFKEEYMILAGLAFGTEKPASNLLLKPLSDELDILKEGIEVKLSPSNTSVKVKSILLCGTCDALAKSLFMRLINFNGFYGCPRCLAKGEKSAESEKVFVYPYEENVLPRTVENYKEHLQAVKNNGYKEPVFGVKGPTYLINMVWAFFLTSTAVDVMHNVYLGVCRQLFFLWTKQAFIKQVFGDGAEKKTLIDKLSEILCKMEAPHYLSRAPRSLNHVKYFKASEFRTWLFSTGLPLMEKYMKEPYLTHFKKLVCAVSLLNKSSVSVIDVATAKTLLQSFVCDFQQLYGLRNMSFNVHCLLHLSDVVTLLGPLNFSSCFGFESLNGRLARLVHGTRHAGLQIYANLDLLRHLSPLVKSLLNPAVKSFCDRITRRSHHLNFTESVCKGIAIIGNVVKEHVLPPVFSAALCHVTNVSSNIAFFFRLKKQKYLFVAEDYGRGSRNSACVKYKSDRGDLYGSVKCFVKVTDTNTSYNALINRLQVSVPFSVADVPILSILLCTPTEIIDFVPITQLECVCFKMCVDSKTYLSVPLNDHELE